MRKSIMIKGVLIILLGLILGLFIGTNVGGNYFPDFEFLGGRGYEATGYLGAIIGGILALIASFVLVFKQSEKGD